MTRPLALNLPLQGRQWIEASAGTGKTFTLSLLVLRLLLEREIPLPNILAVTFTKAATQELKIKIRAQIKSAQDILASGQFDTSATAVFLHDLLQQKPEKHLRDLLETALQDCDRASIFTIHGFCMRVLADNALSAGEVLQAPTLLTSTAALNMKLALDIWRESSTDRELMRSLVRLWPSPEWLAQQCDVLLQAEYLLPELSEVLPPEFDMSAHNIRLRQAVELHLEDARALMKNAVHSEILHSTHMSQGIVDASFDRLETWYSLDNAKPFEDHDFVRLSASHIAVKVLKDHKDKTPVSPLFDAVGLWYEGYGRTLAADVERDIYCLHRVRDRLKARREILVQKRQQYAYDDLIGRVVRGLESDSGAALCNALRKDYPVALVDEFQDTDSQQWKIFSTLYPDHLPDNALYLIGDPKQAIYGFRGGDVHAYLAAKQETRSHWHLPENFRSRPSVLSAVETLFDEAGAHAFREQDIHFYPVHAGGLVQESDFLRDGEPAPAMHLALLPEYIDPKKNTAAALPVNKARELATQACAEKIHEVLLAGQNKQACLKDKETGGMRSVQARDIAVLVNKNAEALQVQAALATRGIASVISSQESLFGTIEAQEIFVILDALIHHRDQARWRGALSTVLLGYQAEQIRQLDSDAAAATQSADLAVAYRELWFKQGVLSLLAEACARAAAKILSLDDGERRLSNYLQLAESLQQAGTLNQGPEHCLRWLGQAMQEASKDEENMLRLDSDQKRVKILTLHKSKGLEFPLVFMPFANFGKSSKSGTGLSILNYHEQHRRISHAMVYGDSNKELVAKIKARAAEENIAEQIRLLYVGLTRAQYYCWVCCGSVNQANTSGLSSLLFRNAKDEIKTSARAEYLSRLRQICERNPAIVLEETGWQKQAFPRFRDADANAPVMIAKPATHLQQDWRILSFSQLTHGSHQQGPSVSAAGDETPSDTSVLTIADEIVDRRFAGIAFGNALHQVLENADVAAWREHGDPLLPPESELAAVEQALLREGYRQEELQPGTGQISPLIFNTLRARLPEGMRLCDLPDQARLNEMEFHFSLRPCDSASLLSLLKKYGILSEREEFPFLRRLNGLMTGKIDLIYQYDKRFYICDYKSNRLPAYDAAHCRQAMRDSEYDFQALVYTLALHRWCKFRLPSHYDYEKHIGGIRYLFCRGLKADSRSEEDGDEGMVAMRFDRALIEQLENLLHPAGETVR